MSADKRILLPVDVANPHPQYITLLDRMLSLSGSTVHILYVHEELPALENVLRTLAHSADEFNERVRDEANRVLTQFSDAAKQCGAAVTQEIVNGPAGMMIEAVAKDEQFDLIAMTPGGKPGIDSYLLGRVSSKVVRHAPATVLLLRGDASTSLDHIVVGLDGSDESFNALRKSVPLFSIGEKKIKVTLVNVVSVHPIVTMVSPVESAAAIESNLKMSGEIILSQGEEILRNEFGVSGYQIKLKEGNAANELQNAATECGADLIVCASQGKGALEHFLMGSTSAQLAVHAKCSLAIFKKPAEAVR